jgi:CRP/FNR family transcriptional regulator, cyclic AMP receptor protein
MRKILFIFGQLTDGDVSWLATVGRRKRIAAGAVLIEEGVPVEILYIVLSGELTVTQGKLRRPIARLGAGEVVGEMSFIDARPPSATVSAVGDAVVYAVGKERLQQELEANAPFAARFYKAVATFLSDRVRMALGADAGGELDGNVLDNLDRAGARFDALGRQLLDG